MMLSRKKMWVPVAIFSVALVGCGGGGGGGSTSTSGASSPTTNPTSGQGGTNTAFTKTWKFYYEDSGPLWAIAPSTPSTPVKVDPNNVVIAGPAIAGNWASGSLTDEYPARVVYARSNGTAWRVSTDLSVSPPAPEQLSSQNGTNICTFRIGQDFNDPDNARVLIGLKGSQSCSNGIGSWKIVRLGAGATRAAANFPGKPLVGVIDPSDGSHVGWLSLSGASVELVTESLGIVTTHGINGSPNGIASADYLETLKNGNVLLNLDGQIYEYVESTNRLHIVDSSFTFAVETYMGNQIHGKEPEHYVTDGAELYFVDDHTLYRTNLGNQTVEILDKPGNAVEDLGGAMTGPARLTVTDKRVVWTYPVDDDNIPTADHVVIRNVDKTSGGGVTVEKIARTSALDGANQAYYDRSGGWFFYTRNPSANSYTAVAYNADTRASQTFSDSQWVGASVNLAAFQDLGTSAYIAYIVSNYAAMVSGSGQGQLKSFSVNAPSSLTTLGVLPSLTQAVLMTGGYGADRLGTISVDTGGSSESDVIFVNGETAGSLTPVTSTQATNEIPVVFF